MLLYEKMNFQKYLHLVILNLIQNLKVVLMW